MASVSILSSPAVFFSRRSSPSASLTFLTGSSSRISPASVSLVRPAPLHCSFCPSSSISSASSFSGTSLGFGFHSSTEARTGIRRGLVVRAGKAALCQTKRNRSRKSLARTHGFRRRMRTTSGRAILKRRRAKGRWVLCPKSHHKSGKES